MRAIDADELLTAFPVDDEPMLTKSCVRMTIQHMPTIEPQPIIHCKDCKNSEHWYRDRCRCFLWYEDGIGVFEDGFCNYAERRQDEVNSRNKRS